MTTVLLVHGIRTSATMWRRQVGALEAAGVQALAPDLPGHGTRREEEFTVAGAVATLTAAAQVPGPLVVAGLSLGGYLAIHWAATAERPPDGVVAASCSTVPRGPGLTGYRALARLVARLPDRGAGLGDAMARRFLPPEAVTDVGAGGIALEVMDAALAGVAGLDPLAELAAITAPVWIVNGRLDHFRLHERRYLRACRDGRLVHVPGATHLVALTDPVPFTRVLLEAAAVADARAGSEATR